MEFRARVRHDRFLNPAPLRMRLWERDHVTGKTEVNLRGPSVLFLVLRGSGPGGCCVSSVTQVSFMSCK